MEWELSKENVQPLKKGRNADALNHRLKEKLEGKDIKLLDEERRAYLRSIDTYIGDDPLRSWLRYIKWTKEAFPSSSQAELLPVLEQCTKTFQRDHRYKQDIRYLRVWIQYADCCSEPRDIFQFLEANNIGQGHALFYEAFATYLELRRNYAKANAVYLAGIARGAEPSTRLSSMHRSFEERMARRIQRKVQEDKELASANERNREDNVQARAFGATRLPRTSGALSAQSIGRRQPQQGQPIRPHRDVKSQFKVYADENLDDQPLIKSSKEDQVDKMQVGQWPSLGTQRERRKENTQLPTKWNNVKVPQKRTQTSSVQAELEVYVDEEFASTKLVPAKNGGSTTLVERPATLRLRLDDAGPSGEGVEKLKLPHLLQPSRLVPAPMTTSHSLPESGGPERIPPKDGMSQSPWRETTLSSVTNSEQQQNFLLPPAAAASGSGAPRTAVDKNQYGFSHHLLLQGGKEVSFEEVRLLEFEGKHGTTLATTENDGEGKESNSRMSPHRDHSGQATDEKKHLTDSLKTAKEVDAATGLASCDREGSTKPRSLLAVFSDAAGELTKQKDIIGHDLLEDGANNMKEEHCADRATTEKACNRSERKEAIVGNRVSSFGLMTSVAAPDYMQPVFGVNKEPDGDETMALRKIGAGPILLSQLSSGIQDGCARPEIEGRHSGLVDTTINTKEALADIMSMFNEPLPCEDSSPTKSPYDGAENLGLMQQTKNTEPFSIFTDTGLGDETEPVTTFVAQAFERQDRFPPAGGFDGSNGDNPNMAGARGNGKPEDRPLDCMRGEASNMGHRQCQGNSRSRDMEECFDPDAENRPPEMQKDHSFPRRHLDSPKAQQAILQPLGDDRMQQLKIRLDQGEMSGGDERIRDASIVLSAQERFTLPTKVAEENFTVWSDEPEESAPKADAPLPSDVQAPQRTIELVEFSDQNPVMLDPWTTEVVHNLLVDWPLNTQKGFIDCQDELFKEGLRLKALKKTSLSSVYVELGENLYMVKTCLGQGAFARIYQAYNCSSDAADETTALHDEDGVALKVQTPPCPWEFYIYRQLDQRISESERPCFGKCEEMYMYSDSSILVCGLKEHGSLQDVINAHLAKGLKMDEVLCVFYTIEMLRMLETLHSANVIHGDFKPDNLLIRDTDSGEWEPWSPSRPGCWAHKGLCLIDWGRSIDLARFPQGTAFIGDCMTEAFRSPEMLEHRPWTFQVDTYGLCGVMHCMLHGSYMEVHKFEEAGRIRYRSKTPFKRYTNKELWERLFDALLNVPNCGQQPPLASFRRELEEYLCSSPNKLASLRLLLMKQNILMDEQRKAGP